MCKLEHYNRLFWFIANVGCAVVMLSNGEYIGFLNVCMATFMFAHWLDGVTG